MSPKYEKKAAEVVWRNNYLLEDLRKFLRIILEILILDIFDIPTSNLLFIPKGML